MRERFGLKLPVSESSCLFQAWRYHTYAPNAMIIHASQHAPLKALSVDEDTLAVLVDREKCTGCGQCIKSCPGNIPFLHPEDNKAVICDLCGGDPECVKVCQEARFDALVLIRQNKEWAKRDVNRRLFAQTSEELTKDVAVNLLGEKAEEGI